jgi:hypothetical protein
LDAYPATRKKVCDGGDRFLGAFSARTYGQDEITERKSGAWLENLLRFIHFVSVSSNSNSDAIVGCEYLVHARRAVIHFLCTLKLTVERHFCSIFEHKKFSRAELKTHRFPEIVTTQQGVGTDYDYEPERGFINHSVSI